MVTAITIHVKRGADYGLAVKDNQPTLRDGIEWHFLCQRNEHFAHVPVSHHQSDEQGHGRQERRSYFVCDVPRDLPDRQRWPQLTAIGLAISDTLRDGKVGCEERFYILSKTLSAQRFAEAVRSHGSIENRRYWQLDGTFQEDPSPVVPISRASLPPAIGHSPVC